jgi:hypothetical protein
MSRVWSVLAAGAIAIVVAGCSTGQPGDTFAPASGATMLAIALPEVHSERASIDWASEPNLLSSATRSVSGSIGTRRFGPVALSPAQPFCQTESTGLACTLAISAVPGLAQKLQLTTYATANGKGPALAVGTTTLAVHRGRNDVAVPLFGLAQQIAVRPRSNVVRQGNWQPEPLVIYGIDAAKAAIPAVSVLNRRGTASVDAVNVTLSGFLNATVRAPSGEPLTCCGIAGPTFAYDGLHAGRETFTAQAPGYASYSTHLTVLPGSNAPATIVLASTYADDPGSSYIDFVEQFSANAAGNAMPVRSFVPPASGKLGGEDSEGDVWIGGTHLSNTGSVLGRVAVPERTENVAVDGDGNLYAASPCGVYEYPAGRYGAPKPLRHIDFPNCNADDDLAVDRNGDVFISFPGASPSQGSEIHEYAAGSSSGTVKPIRRIAAPASSGSTFIGLDTDAAGNLYALNVATLAYQLLKFAPGSTAGQVLLNDSMGAFAVDDRGGIYASVSSGSPTTASLEYFPPGARTPAQIISGSATRMSGVSKIVVPRT